MSKNKPSPREPESLGGSISRSTPPPSVAQNSDTPRDFSAYLSEVPRGQTHRGWYKPGHLPHFDSANIYQLVTYRLADSLPQLKLQQLEAELRNTDPKLIDSERRETIEQILNSGHGSCVLKHAACAQCVIDSWKHLDEKHYRLKAWTVMPNHVHVLIQQREDHRLSDIVASWKKFTARKIHALIDNGSIPGRVALQSDHTNECRSGDRHSHRALWQWDYWDRFIRNEEHFHAAVDYILNNAVKARLVNKVSDWPWCGTNQD